jgi:hypothetical protein
VRDRRSEKGECSQAFFVGKRHMLRAKRLSDLTEANISALVAAQLPESQDIEFKVTLPAKGTEVDPWMGGGSSVGNRARDALIAELIGFANSYGGDLVLGIEESDDHPRRAVAIRPLPRCHELADRLRMQARDCVDPAFPHVEVQAIPVGEEGAGVLVLRVPQSRLRPHRLKSDLNAYVRRADRNEAMTMREIQDLTMLRDRQSIKTEEALAARRSLFHEALRQRRGSAPTGGQALRITAMPASTEGLDAEAVRRACPEVIRGHYAATYRNQDFELSLPFMGVSQRPILAGTRWYHDTPYTQVTWDLHYNGMCEFVLWRAEGGVSEIAMHCEWIAAALIDVLILIDKVRMVGGSPSLEYGLELEANRRGGNLEFFALAGRSPTFATLKTDGPELLLAPLAFSERSDIPQVASLVLRDVYNACAIDFDTQSWSCQIDPK